MDTYLIRLPELPGEQEGVCQQDGSTLQQVHSKVLASLPREELHTSYGSDDQSMHADGRLCACAHNLNEDGALVDARRAVLCPLHICPPQQLRNAFRQGVSAHQLKCHIAPTPGPPEQLRQQKQPAHTSSAHIHCMRSYESRVLFLDGDALRGSGMLQTPAAAPG
jgi:hypothetical protein